MITINRRLKKGFRHLLPPAQKGKRGYTVLQRRFACGGHAKKKPISKATNLKARLGDGGTSARGQGKGDGTVGTRHTGRIERESESGLGCFSIVAPGVSGGEGWGLKGGRKHRIS